MTRQELADWLYADEPNGGPENKLAVCHLAHQARLQLVGQGLTSLMMCALCHQYPRGLH